MHLSSSSLLTALDLFLQVVLLLKLAIYLLSHHRMPLLNTQVFVGGQTNQVTLMEKILL